MISNITLLFLMMLGIVVITSLVGYGIVFLINNKNATSEDTWGIVVLAFADIVFIIAFIQALFKFQL